MAAIRKFDRKQISLQSLILFAALSVSLIFVTLSACQLAPTRLGSRESRELEQLQKPLEITDKTVVLDARSTFDYGLNHINNSHHLPWENLAENYETGEPLRDPRKAGLKLSLLGIQPDTPVIVVGKATQGSGEEGRVAWMLQYLGIEDVKIASHDLFRRLWTQKASAQPQNAPTWTASPRQEMVIGKEEFLKLAKDAKGRLEKRIHIIDVRSEAEYLHRDSRKPKSPPIDLNTMHIEWKEFFTAQGRPNLALRKKLESVNVQPGDRVILVSEKGVRSSAASYALMALGYKRVQNFVAGWRVLAR